MLILFQNGHTVNDSIVDAEAYWSSWNGNEFTAFEHSAQNTKLLQTYNEI